MTRVRVSSNSFYLTPLSEYGNTTKYPVSSYERIEKSDVTKGDFIHTNPYRCVIYTRNGSCGVGLEIESYNASTKKWSVYDRMIVAANLPNSSLNGTATWYAGFSGESSYVDTLRNSLQLQMSNKVLEGNPSWDVMTDVYEVRKTGESIRDVGKMLLGISKGIVLRNPSMILRAFGKVPKARSVSRLSKKLRQYQRGGLNNFQVASNLWLQYRYGVMPLLYSCQDAIRSFYTTDWTSKVQQRISVGGTTCYSISPTYTNYNTGIVTYTGGWIRNCEVGIRKIAYVSYQSGLAARLIQNPLVAPLRTAWEEVPFSFVVDWFYSVGDSINSLNLASVVSADSWVCESVRGKATEIAAVYNINPASSTFRFKYLSTGLSTQIVATTTTYSRSKGSFSWAKPVLSQGLSNFKRCLDSLFLGVNNAKSLRNTSFK